MTEDVHYQVIIDRNQIEEFFRFREEYMKEKGVTDKEQFNKFRNMISRGMDRMDRDRIIRMLPKRKVYRSDFPKDNYLQYRVALDTGTKCFAKGFHTLRKFTYVPFCHTKYVIIYAWTLAFTATIRIRGMTRVPHYLHNSLISEQKTLDEYYTTDDGVIKLERNII